MRLRARSMRWCGLLILVTVHASAAAAQGSESIGALNRQMSQLWSAGRYGEATEVAQRLLALIERSRGANDSSVANMLNNIGGLQRLQGNLEQAERLYTRAIEIMEATGATRSVDYGTTLTNKAEVLRALRRDDEAEPLFKKAQVALERAVGPNHSTVGLALSGLGGLYRAQGRFAEAEPLYLRDLAIVQRDPGADPTDAATAMNNLGSLYEDMGNIQEAERFYRSALAVYEKHRDAEHPFIGTALNNLGLLYSRNGRLKEAEPFLLRALAIGEKRLGKEHSNVGIRVQNLAGLYRKQGRMDAARSYFERALTITRRSFGEGHPNVAQVLVEFSSVPLTQKNWAESFSLLDRAADILITRTRRAGSDVGRAPVSRQGSETTKSSFWLSLAIKAAHRLSSSDPRQASRLADRTFQLAQWARNSAAAASLTQMSARLAGKDTTLSAIVRERQDLYAEWQKADAELVASRAQPAGERNAQAENRLSSRLVDMDRRLATIDARLKADFANYEEIASPDALSIRDVQALLGPDEALVAVHDTSAWEALAEETFVWIITRSDHRWHSSALGAKALARQVRFLRCGLDGAAAASADCATLTGSAYTEADRQAGKPLPFDTTAAHGLYQALFQNAGDTIRGKHLLVVASGSLTRLPLHVLVTSPVQQGDLRSVRWLVRENASTVLPAVSSLKALRRDGRPSAARLPLIGFGDPLLDGDQAHPRHGSTYRRKAALALAKSQAGCAGSAQVALGGEQRDVRGLSAPSQRSGIVDVAELRLQPPLPETADELCDVARALGADLNQVYLGARAAERLVKQLSAATGPGRLSNFKVIHFATHGTLAGDLTGAAEPGLILTPSAQPGREDDGYLSASEIAGLKLDADWVILSACNTAGASGSEESGKTEPLSGLARSFFYAGARAVLVSHWAVDSQATTQLITATIGAITRAGSIGRAEALRRAILAMIDAGRPHRVHPAYWAPFVVVGEGGAGR